MRGLNRQSRSIIAGFTAETGETYSSIDDRYRAVESSRVYLSAQQLIHELWVLQRAGVQPDDLFQHRDALDKVLSVLAEAPGPRRGGGENPYRTIQPRTRDAAEQLASFTQFALLGSEQMLVTELRNAAGMMNGDLLQARSSLCTRFLAQLEPGSPWDPATVMANAVGTRHWEYIDFEPDSPEPGITPGTAGPDIAALDIAQARQTFLDKIDRAAARITPEETQNAVTTRRNLYGASAGEWSSYVNSLDVQVDFLSKALALREHLRAHPVQINNRPVAPGLVRDLFQRLADGIQDAYPGYGPACTWSLGPMAFQMRYAPEQDAVKAQVNLAGDSFDVRVQDVYTALRFVTAPNPHMYIAGLREVVKQARQDMNIPAPEATSRAGLPGERAYRSDAGPGPQPPTRSR
ncbi:hypothetical protein D5S17_35885 [Pseudonocardiaceae bacterium YIM PH 21723]|nr:hypothetical protein D5S17_35885 [Pseudonocardiaceae bacterium YIM PH 21723]